MYSREQLLRTLAVYAVSPALFFLIAMVVVMRPLTAYADGFHGPEGMWRDIRAWARTGNRNFSHWKRATRSHLSRPGVY